MKRKMIALGALALVLGGCNGWPGTVPYNQALNKPEKYPTYAGVEGHPVEFYAGNHRYMVLPGEINLRTARTAPVGAGGTGSIFALQGDEAPYSSLFARSAEGRTHAVGLID